MADDEHPLMGQIRQLPEDQRHRLIAELVYGFEKDVLKACQHFEECDSCRKIVLNVTEDCEGYKDGRESMQRCCDDCVKHCVCGKKSFAPSASYHYEECPHEESDDEYVPRCFCGKPIEGERGVHGKQCIRYAQMKLSIDGEPTEEQKQAISNALVKHEMIQEGWISSKKYGVVATSTFTSISEANPRSLFAASYGQQVGEIPLEFVELRLLFTRKDGSTETTFLHEDTDTFDVPDPDSDEVYESLSLHMVLKIPERVVKKARIL